MKIKAFRVRDDFELLPAALERGWMDETPDRYAYRCLPLNIANQHGWYIPCPGGFRAWWDGGPHASSVHIEPETEGGFAASSDFGAGIITFPVPFLFRTPPGVQMQAMSMPNQTKDAIQALSGIIETDWSPYSFTMNWRFTRPNTVISFERGEPYCFLFPLRLDLIESLEAETTAITNDQEVADELFGWAKARNSYYQEVRSNGVKDGKGWQGHYFRGVHLDGRKAAQQHRTKVKTPVFREAVTEPEPADGVNAEAVSDESAA